MAYISEDIVNFKYGYLNMNVILDNYAKKLGCLN